MQEGNSRVMTKSVMNRANKAKRVAIAAQNIATEAEIEINTVEKSVTVLKTIYKAIENNLLFDIHDEARAALIASMTPLPAIPKDTVIINQVCPICSRRMNDTLIN